MKLLLRVLPEAEAELEAAARWYESKRAGLGAALLANVDEALAAVLDAPRGAPLWRKGRPYRKFVLRRFPYVIFFVVQEHTVAVVAVAHAKRRPGYWKGRASREP